MTINSIVENRALHEIYLKSFEIAEAGTFTIEAGASSRNILLSGTVEMTGGDRPFIYDGMTPLAWFVQNEKFLHIIDTEMPEKSPIFRQETFEWLCLVLPLPFYKMAQPYLGDPLLTEDEVEYILNKMNE